MFRLLCFALLFVFNTQALYPSDGNVAELTSSNFDSLVTTSDEIWIVKFFVPGCGHCKNVVPEITRAANALKGLVKVGAVNADECKELAERFKVERYPTIKVFGADKLKPQDYDGAKTAEGIASAAHKAAIIKVQALLGEGKSNSSISDVVELTDSNFDRLVLKSEDMWLVKFFAPWCGHCQTLAPHWAKAASELKGKVKLGALDATKNSSKTTMYKIQGYPTIKFFPPGPNKSASSSEDYDGGRTSSDIVQWALDKLASTMPGPDVNQIILQDLFKKQCEEKPLCVISVLPHIIDCQADCRNSYIKMLTEIGEKFKRNMWGWVWAEAGAQPYLEDAVGIGGFGYPAMAAINTNKMKYTILRGSFSKNGIYEFLRDLSYGKGHTVPLKGHIIPRIVDSDPWDGKNIELPPEEDIDLSDVELDDIRRNEL